MHMCISCVTWFTCARTCRWVRLTCTHSMCVCLIHIYTVCRYTTHVRMCVYIAHVHIYICVHGLYAHVFTLCAYACVYIHKTPIHSCVCITYVQVHVHAFTYIHLHVCTICAYTCMCTWKYTYHMHTPESCTCCMKLSRDSSQHGTL
jgi:hypothetical protein